MNGLSWLLYFADISEALRLFSTFSWIISALVVVSVTVVWMTVVDDKSTTDKDKQEMMRIHGRIWWFFFPIFIIFMLFFIVIPQRQTFMLIAASEFGEEVLNNADVQSIGGEAGDLAVDSMSLLRKYINEQLGNDDVPSDTKVE